MMAAKIRLLFAVFCYFLFSKREFVLRELVNRVVTSRLITWLLCLLRKQRQGLQICLVIYYLALPRSMIVAIEQTASLVGTPAYLIYILF